MTKTIKQNKAKIVCKKKQKKHPNPPPKLPFSTIHVIRTNFFSAESFFLECFPDILVLCETNLNSSVVM